MDITEINSILERAPAKIAYYCEKENNAYSQMLNAHEEYKRRRAKQYLEIKIKAENSIKDIEYMLDCDNVLSGFKDAEIKFEIDYRSWRQKKEKAKDFFEAAKNLGYNLRKNIDGLSDTIK